MNPKDGDSIHLSDAAARVAVQMSGGGVIRVLIRSTSPFTRAGLESALSADPRFEIVHENSFDSEQDADVILLDGTEPSVERLRSTSSNPAHAPHRILLAHNVSRSAFSRLFIHASAAFLPT
jgi:DNA-binding NarL/FixJ family response regulator